MAIAMTLRFVDVICDGSLQNTYINGKKIGYQFNIRLSYYRGHFLSVINEISLAVDGEEVEEQNITFCLHGKEYGLSQLKELNTEFWPIQEEAAIKVFQEDGLAEGNHEIDFHMVFRSPYMPIGEGEYMPWDSSQKKVLELKGLSKGSGKEGN